MEISYAILVNFFGALLGVELPPTASAQLLFDPHCNTLVLHWPPRRRGLDAAEMFSGIYAAMTDLFCYFYFSLACPQDSRAGLPRFARPGRDWIHLVCI